MKSPFTGKEMMLVRENRQMIFRKEEFEYVHHAYLCSETEEQFTTTELDNLNIFQVYNQYREKHNIPFPEEIRQIRYKYGVSAAKMSEILGFGANSYRLYEDGEVPQLSNARLIQNSASTLIFKNMVELCDTLDERARVKILHNIHKIMEEEKQSVFDKYFINKLLGEVKPTKYTGYCIPNISKIQEMVVFFSEKLEPFKTKLNKLLFYSDFYNYKEYGYSMSGLRYRAIDMGPVPNNYNSIFEFILEKQSIEIHNIVFDNDKSGEQFKVINGRTFDSSIFTEQELFVLEKVLDTFKGTKTDKLIDKSHNEKAWIEPFQTKSLIPYSYAFELKHI